MLKRWRLFWEVAIGDQVDFNLTGEVSCCEWYTFKVVNVPGTLKWRFHYDAGADGGWVQIGPSDGAFANFGKGIPMGETGRRGGVQTGASDHHKDLQYKGQDGNWYAWGTNFVHHNSISNWHHDFIRDDEYKVLKDA